MSQHVASGVTRSWRLTLSALARRGSPTLDRYGALLLCLRRFIESGTPSTRIRIAPKPTRFWSKSPLMRPTSCASVRRGLPIILQVRASRAAGPLEDEYHPHCNAKPQLYAE